MNEWVSTDSRPFDTYLLACLLYFFISFFFFLFFFLRFLWFLWVYRSSFHSVQLWSLFPCVSVIVLASLQPTVTPLMPLSLLNLNETA